MIDWNVGVSLEIWKLYSLKSSQSSRSQNCCVLLIAKVLCGDKCISLIFQTYFDGLRNNTDLSLFVFHLFIMSGKSWGSELFIRDLTSESESALWLLVFAHTMNWTLVCRGSMYFYTVTIRRKMHVDNVKHEQSSTKIIKHDIWQCTGK